MTSLFNRGFLLVGIATLLLLGVVVLSRVPENAAAQASSSDRTLTVTGHGQVTGKPDLATVRLGVETTASTAAQAMAVTGQKLNAVLAAIKALGIEDKDIQTTALNLFPIRRPFPIIQQEGEQTPTAAGYRRTNAHGHSNSRALPACTSSISDMGLPCVSQVRVTVRDLDKAVWVIDGAVGQGANLVSGVSFGISDPPLSRTRPSRRQCKRLRPRRMCWRRRQAYRSQASSLSLKVGLQGLSPSALPRSRGGASQCPSSLASSLFRHRSP